MQTVTIYSLAKELGVSPTAVSRAFDPNSRLSKEKRALILAAARYGFTPNKMASRLSMPEIRIGVVNFSYIKEYYTEIVRGIQSTHRALKDYKVECDMRILQRGEDTLEEAFSVLEEFREKKYSGVIISGIYESEVIGQIDLFAEAGIPVVLVQHEIADSKRLFSSVGNYPVIGAMAAELCGMMLHGNQNKNVVMFTGNRISSTHRVLVDSFLQHTEENRFRVVEIYDTKDNYAIAEELVKKAFETHGEIGALYVSSANSIPICKYLEATGRSESVTVIASDVFAELVPYIRKGVINATIFQDPFHIGYNAFKNFYRALADGEVFEPVIMPTPQVVLASNLDLYLPESDQAEKES